MNDADQVVQQAGLESVRQVLCAFRDGHGFVQAAIESFNYLMQVQIPAIVTEKKEIWVESSRCLEKILWQIDDVTILKPTVQEEDGRSHVILPSEARLRKLTYSCTVRISFTFVEFRRDSVADEYKVVRRLQHRDKPLCNMPTMVRSLYCNESDVLHNTLAEECPECPRDPGGYFVVNGTEKVVIMQEDVRTNVAHVRELGASGRFSHVCEVRSLPEGKLRSTSTLYVYMLAPKMVGLGARVFIQIPFLKCTLSPYVLFRMLGVEQLSDMRRLVVGEGGDERIDHVLDWILESDNSASGPVLPLEAIESATAKKAVPHASAETRSARLRNTITNEFLPHMGTEDDAKTRHAKLIFFGLAVQKLLLVFVGAEAVDDRDDYVNKRIRLPGALLALQFRQIHRNFMKGLHLNIRKCLEKCKRINPLGLLRARKMSANLQYPLATGNWGVAKGGSTQTGVAHVLSRLTFVGMLSHLRRVNTPLQREGKRAGPRQLKRSRAWIICPAETPEGESCGLMQNLAFLCHVRIGGSSSLALTLIEKHPDTRPLSACNPEDFRRGATTTRICVNGVLVGLTSAGQELWAQLCERRTCGDLPEDTTLALVPGDPGELSVLTDPGNPARPVFVLARLDQLKGLIHRYRGPSHSPRVMWTALFRAGVVQYLDNLEEKMYRVAPDPSYLRSFPDTRYTHMEIHPCAMLGLCAGIIPFAQHNQSPRNAYSSSMGKQPASNSTTNLNQRMDTISHRLQYGQRPLVQTATHSLLGLDDTPSGQTPIVAVLTYTGYNMEDSIIINKASLERGMFRTDHFRTYREDHAVDTTTEGPQLAKVDPADPEVRGVHTGNYDTLDDDGLPAVRTVLNADDAIIGRVLLGHDGQRTDLTTFMKSTESAQVTKVARTIGRDDRAYVTVQTCSTRVPEIGDKFASRHGQKGVCGMILAPEDMPFVVASGDRVSYQPDIIINPHGQPSRMTVAQVLEGLFGKLVCAGFGGVGDGTTFQTNLAAGGDWTQYVRDELLQRGFQPDGNERMINGMTGELMEASIFVTPVYYQRLKHMVPDKIHARTNGPVSLLTRQPSEGRSKDGGLRFGEMERDTQVCHGASEVLKDRLFAQSDPFKVPVCGACGMIAEGRKSTHAHDATAYCRGCGTDEHVVETYIPYAFKLALQEMNAMHIAARLRFT